MTLSSLLAELYRRLNHPTSPQTAVTTRLTALVNEGMQELISLPGMGGWITQHQPALTVASVASSPFVTLPPYVSRVEGVRDTTNDWTLAAQTRDWYHQVESDPATETGTPEVWVPYGIVGVAKQPSDASEIFAKSTSGSDTQTAYLQGVRTGGYPVSLSVSLTGATAVSLGSSYTDIIAVTKFYLASAAVGTVTLLEDSGSGTELARIAIGQTQTRYQQIALWPTPASSITYTIDAEREVYDLVNAGDEPLLPARFHRLLVDYALWKEFDKVDDTRGAQAEQRWRKGVSDLRYFLTCPPDFLPVAGRMGARRSSRLGPYYPAD